VSAVASFQKTSCVAFSSSIAASGTHTALNQSKSMSNTSSSSHSSSSISLSSVKIWDDGRNESLNKCILPLSSNSHKGSSGRVAVVGGSARYTGAPYYAAMASLQAGADLAYVFTAQEAAVPIKCYSPELMVAPVYSATEFDNVVERKELDSPDAQRLVDDVVQQVVDSMPRLHCLVIGPGLGRCPLVFKAVAGIIQAAREQNLFLVIDADALYMLSLPEYRNLLQGYDKVMLTPNVIEYKRLFAKDSSTGTSLSTEGGGESEATNSFASAVIVVKGEHDEIYRNGARVMVCEEQGGLKRSGGIGDVLAGTVSTLVAWHVILKGRNVDGTTVTDTDADADLALSCWTACCFIKRATKRAFDSKRRSMTAPDVLDELGPSIDTMTS
jgi:ATP-dependent NAD(P)H-hydrate dehydratase